jgi:hypothetical protein
MPSQRAMRSVLGNFLGTFTSRYSDFDGYWLFGFLLGDNGELRIDLLNPSVHGLNIAGSAAAALAVDKFDDQLKKAGFSQSQVRDAWLLIDKLPGLVSGTVNGHPCSGYRVSVSAGAAMDDGRRYEKRTILFVAPHDSAREYRSAKAD